MGNTKKKRRNDILLLTGLLLLGAILFFAVNAMKEGGAQVEIIVDGKAIEHYPLDKDREIKLDYGGYNVLAIRDGYASVTSADCPDKLCVDQRKISKTGETIVCLPHKVVIKVSGGESPEYDTVAQ